jgi:hypothetical protein
LRDNQAKKKLKERAMNPLEEENRIVIQIFKLDRKEEIQKNVIKEFFKKGDKAYWPIFGVIIKFFKDIDQSLTKFTDAILPVSNFLKNLKAWKLEQRIVLQDSDDESEFRRRKGKEIVFGGFEDLVG